jgi:hypothetical protein
MGNHRFLRQQNTVAWAAFFHIINNLCSIVGEPPAGRAEAPPIVTVVDEVTRPLTLEGGSQMNRGGV